MLDILEIREKFENFCGLYDGIVNLYVNTFDINKALKLKQSDMQLFINYICMGYNRDDIVLFWNIVYYAYKKAYRKGGMNIGDIINCKFLNCPFIIDMLCDNGIFLSVSNMFYVLKEYLKNDKIFKEINFKDIKF